MAPMHLRRPSGAGSGSNWRGYTTVTIGKYDLMRTLGIKPRFSWFERTGGRAIALYALWRIVRHG